MRLIFVIRVLSPVIIFASRSLISQVIGHDPPAVQAQEHEEEAEEEEEEEGAEKEERGLLRGVQRNRHRG